MRHLGLGLSKNKWALKLVQSSKKEVQATLLNRKSNHWHKKIKWNSSTKKFLKWKNWWLSSKKETQFLKFSLLRNPRNTNVCKIWKIRGKCLMFQTTKVRLKGLLMIYRSWGRVSKMSLSFKILIRKRNSWARCSCLVWKTSNQTWICLDQTSSVPSKQIWWTWSRAMIKLLLSISKIWKPLITQAQTGLTEILTISWQPRSPKT